MVHRRHPQLFYACTHGDCIRAVARADFHRFRFLRISRPPQSSAPSPLLPTTARGSSCSKLAGAGARNSCSRREKNWVAVPPLGVLAVQLAARQPQIRYRHHFSDQLTSLDDSPPLFHPRFQIIDFAPHSELFRLVSGVICHGGCGTVHASLKAGTPTTVAAQFGDQGLWAARCSAVGAGGRPIQTITEAALMQAFEEMRQRCVIEQAAKCGGMLKQESGDICAVESVYRQLPLRAMVSSNDMENLERIAHFFQKRESAVQAILLKECGQVAHQSGEQGSVNSSHLATARLEPSSMPASCPIGRDQYFAAAGLECESAPAASSSSKSQTSDSAQNALDQTITEDSIRSLEDGYNSHIQRARRFCVGDVTDKHLEASLGAFCLGSRDRELPTQRPRRN